MIWFGSPPNIANMQDFAGYKLRSRKPGDVVKVIAAARREGSGCGRHARSDATVVVAGRSHRPGGRSRTAPHGHAGTGRCSVRAAGEVGELLAENQAAAMQTRFQRLILDLEHRAGFLGRHALDVAQHHRRAMNRGQLENRAQRAATQFTAQKKFSCTLATFQSATSAWRPRPSARRFPGRRPDDPPWPGLAR